VLKVDIFAVVGPHRTSDVKSTRDLFSCLCFVDRASMHKLVNRTNSVHKFS